MGNFTMTDVAWSPLDVNRIAASATNGSYFGLGIAFTIRVVI